MQERGSDSFNREDMSEMEPESVGTVNKCLYDESMEPAVGKRVEAEGWQ